MTLVPKTSCTWKKIIENLSLRFKCFLSLHKNIVTLQQLLLQLLRVLAYFFFFHHFHSGGPNSLSTEVSHFGKRVLLPTFGKAYWSQWDECFSFPEHNTGCVTLRHTLCTRIISSTLAFIVLSWLTGGTFVQWASYWDIFIHHIKLIILSSSLNHLSMRTKIHKQVLQKKWGKDQSNYCLIITSKEHI